MVTDASQLIIALRPSYLGQEYACLILAPKAAGIVWQSSLPGVLYNLVEQWNVSTDIFYNFKHVQQKQKTLIVNIMNLIVCH